jgi:glycosyltransferase involved in cell wall biosynthesis
VRVLFVTSRLPFPPATGRKSLLYFRHKGLAEAGDDIFCASFVDDRRYLDSKPEFIRTLRLLRSNSLGSLLSVGVNSVIRRRWSIQSSLHYSRSTLKELNAWAAQFRPDVVVGDMLRLAPLVYPLPYPTVLDMDDLLSARYSELLSSDQTQTALGQFGKTLPGPIRSMAQLAVRPALRLEKSLIEQQEKRAAKEFDEVVLVSAAEAQQLAAATGAGNIHSVPMAVPIPATRVSQTDPRRDGRMILLTGVMNLSHNVDAALELVNQILPAILKRYPNANVCLAGSDPVPSIKKLDGGAVTVTGHVPDLKPYLEKAAVFVAPLRIGTGVKTKLLEAMANGVPIITTPLGALGVTSAHSDPSPMILRDDPGEMVEAICELFSDSQERERLASDGYEFVGRNYSPDVISNRFREILVKARGN